MRILWTLAKVILALAIAIPLGILAVGLAMGILGSLFGIAVLVLRLAILGFIGYGAFMLARRDIRTRQVRYNGELCTEYFDTKDGMEVRAVCPSHGGEWYVDTSRTIQYAPRFPVERSTKPSNDR